jgi:hypothetical protein
MIEYILNNNLERGFAEHFTEPESNFFVCMQFRYKVHMYQTPSFKSIYTQTSSIEKRNFIVGLIRQ